MVRSQIVFGEQIAFGKVSKQSLFPDIILRHHSPKQHSGKPQSFPDMIPPIGNRSQTAIVPRHDPFLDIIPPIDKLRKPAKPTKPASHQSQQTKSRQDIPTQYHSSTVPSQYDSIPVLFHSSTVLTG